MKVHVWAENRPLPLAVDVMKRLYPQGIEGAISAFLSKDEGLEPSSSTSFDEDYGLSDAMLQKTDVLVYWSHKHWREVPEDRVEALYNAVLNGMGLVLLHSAHASKIFSKLLGTRTQSLLWHEDDEKQTVWNVNPAHPIACGIPQSFAIPQDESYGEYFEIPQPDEQIFLTVSESKDVLRSGICYYRGRGKIFYFSAGHETYPVYYQKEIEKIILNAVHWACGSRDTKWPLWAREKMEEQTK